MTTKELLYVEDAWLEAARENRQMPTLKARRSDSAGFLLVEFREYTCFHPKHDSRRTVSGTLRRRC